MPAIFSTLSTLKWQSWRQSSLFFLGGHEVSSAQEKDEMGRNRAILHVPLIYTGCTLHTYRIWQLFSVWSQFLISFSVLPTKVVNCNKGFSDVNKYSTRKWTENIIFIALMPSQICSVIKKCIYQYVLNKSMRRVFYFLSYLPIFNIHL